LCSAAYLLGFDEVLLGLRVKKIFGEPLHADFDLVCRSNLVVMLEGQRFVPDLRGEQMILHDVSAQEIKLSKKHTLHDYHAQSYRILEPTGKSKSCIMWSGNDLRQYGKASGRVRL
jgi:hypothetical protein